jgi:hypothetical protein
LNSRIVPITGVRTSIQSPVSECIGNDKAVGGIVIWFDKDGVMSTGDVGLNLANL